MKQIYIVLFATLLLASCNSGQKQAQTSEPEFDKQQEEQTIKALVDEIYKEVNLRWANDSEGNDYANSLEELYTTKEWQELYNQLRSIESENLKSGNDENVYFAEGGNVWTMGSFNIPFTTEFKSVEFSNDSTADVYFILKPAESDNILIKWEMLKVDGKWLIHNFLQGDENYTEYVYDYKVHMKEFIENNTGV